jgi:hypothetical protein
MWFLLRVCFLQTLFIATALAAVASDDDRLNTQPLVRLAMRHGVPMPPKPACLVLAGTGQNPEIYSPAFLLEAKGDGSVIVLRGFRREVVSKNERGDALWHSFDPKLDHVDFRRVSAFICAIQLAALGDDARAQFLWKEVVDVRKWSDRRTDERHPYETQPPELFLGHCILDDLRMAYLRPGADWREINRRRRALVKEIFNLDWDARATIYGDLLETLYAKPPKAESIEALLLDWSRRPQDFEADVFFEFDNQCPSDDSREKAPARKIIQGGFDSIPDLLNLVDDPRLTAHQTRNSDDSRTNPRLGDLARQLLAEITGQNSNDQGAEAIAGWQSWWEKSRTQNEADVFARAVFQRDRETITSVNEGPAWILARKYPSRLPPLLDECIKLASTDSEASKLADAIAGSTLPQATKERVLAAAAQSGSLENQRLLLQVLAGVNGQKCAELLQPILRNLPQDVLGPYRDCTPAHFSHVVMHVENNEVWRSFLMAAKRSSVGLRLEMMNPMDYAYIGKRNRERRLAFLAAFLDDATVRRMPPREDLRFGKFEDCAASNFPEIEVRNFAAMGIACIIDMCDSPNSSWTSAQWENLRRNVRNRLAHEKLPNLETPPAGS